MDMTHIDSPKTIAARAAAYIVRTRGQSLAAEERDAALKCILDLLSAAAAGIDDIGPKAIRSVARQLFGHGDSPVWFTGKRLSLLAAVWANSAAAAALDLDDGNRFARGHPGAAIIPAVLAVAEEINADLQDILTAIVIGYEVGVTVGAARTSYGSSGTWTPYGVVAALASLRKTPQEIIEHALAIAGESAPNQLFASAPAPRTPSPEGSTVKENIPWSVVTGICALELAQAGYTGPRNLLDSLSHYKFPDALQFGESAHITKTYIKPYACCRHIHAPLAAMLNLLAAHQIQAKSISAIEVETHTPALRISNRPEPKNIVDVQYSIPYCLALVALYGEDALVPVAEAVLGRKDVFALANKVSLSLSPDLDARYPVEILSQVTIVCGEIRYTSEPTPPAGEPLMPWADLISKFDKATRLVATADQRSTLLNAFDTFKTGRVGRLFSCLAETILSSNP